MAMGLKSGLLVLALVFCLHATSARTHMAVDAPVTVLIETPHSEDRMSVVTAEGTKLCTVCEDFTSQVLHFLEDKNNQEKVLEALHDVCSYTFSFEKECIESVDQYSTNIFAEISKINPKDLCKRVDLCKSTTYAIELQRESTCVFCRHLVEEILTKLNDPDQEFEIIEILLKQCAKFEGYVQKCKRMVLQYAPIILVNGGKFLEKNDICAVIGVCAAQRKPPVRAFAAEV